MFLSLFTVSWFTMHHFNSWNSFESNYKLLLVLYDITCPVFSLSKWESLQLSLSMSFFVFFLGGVHVAHLLSFLCFPVVCIFVVSSVLWCPLRFRHKNYVRVVFTSICLYEGSSLIYVSRVCLRILVSNTYCVVLFYLFFVLCALCCQFPWVVQL